MPILALMVDLNGDQKDEIIFFLSDESRPVFTLAPQGWKKIGVLTRGGNEKWMDPAQREKLLEARDYGVVAPASWNRFRIGQTTYVVAADESGPEKD